MRRLSVLVFTLVVPIAVAAAGQELRLPNAEGSVKFAVIGDTGEPSGGQTAIARQMVAWRTKFPFKFALMMGDNLYGSETARDYDKKFADPYKALIDGGVEFHAALGNHDDAAQVQYKLFNMNGQKYYTFKPQNGVRFFAIDSNYLSKEQLDWLAKELAASGSDWKICFFHHPLYSSGKTHGSSLETRAVLEPIFLKNNVDVVFTGHDHIYERVKPQQGIYHFVVGSSGSLRKGDLSRTDLTEKGYDQDYVFLLAEIDGDELSFAALSRTGRVVDSGVLPRPKPAAAASPAAGP
jgi:predicted phosphodiesterase